jgi:F-type H+-transporting ATPase subunit b
VAFLIPQQAIPIEEVQVQIAALIDLDNTFYIQLGIFLLLMFLMKVLVYTPFLTLEETRYNATDGAKKQAKELHKRAEELEGKFSEGIQTAQAKGVESRNALKSEGDAISAEEIAQLRSELEAQLKVSLTELGTHEEEARKTLNAETQRLAKDVADQIMGAQG